MESGCISFGEQERTHDGFVTACPHWLSAIGGVLFVTFVSLFAASAFATDFTGPLVSVLDGDTIEVLHNSRAERIRFNGIDYPEKGQAYGKKAKQAVSALLFGKEVTLQTYCKDKYGQTI